MPASFTRFPAFLCCLAACASLQGGVPHMHLLRTSHTHELSLGVFSFQDKNKMERFSEYHSYWLPGLTYKRHLGSNRIRLGVEILREKTTTPGNISDSRFLSFEGRLGYERAIPMRYYELTLGFDMAMLHQETTYLGGSPGTPQAWGRSYEQGLGFIPVVGLKRYLSPHFSIGTEVNFSIYQAANTIRPRFGWNFRVLSLNYHFW